MGAIIPPTVTDQNTFAGAAAEVHRILSKGPGTEHARIRQVAEYLHQIGQHYYAEGVKAGASDVEVWKKAKTENDDRFMVERDQARQERDQAIAERDQLMRDVTALRALAAASES